MILINQNTHFRFTEHLYKKNCLNQAFIRINLEYSKTHERKEECQTDIFLFVI